MKRVLRLLLLGVLWVMPAMAQERPLGWRPPLPESVPNFREHWRHVVMEISKYAKARNPKFVILVRGGAELLVRGQWEEQWDEIQDPLGINFDKRLPVGETERPYVNAIDGVVFDNLYCGDSAFENKPLEELIHYRLEDDKRIVQDAREGVERPIPAREVGPFSKDPMIEIEKSEEIRHLNDIEGHKHRVLRGMAALKTSNRTLWSIENCPTQSAADQAFAASERDHITSFVSVTNPKLDRIPSTRPRHENANPVSTLGQVKTWLPNLRGDKFASKEDWLLALSKTNYDALVVDVGWRNLDLFNKADITRLKYKALGEPRMVWAEMPMGRAYDRRWYWQKEWKAGDPPFLFAVDRGEPGTYLIDATSQAWLEILGKYVAGLMDLGFDGVMMDDIDTYLWFEDLMPLDR